MGKPNGIDSETAHACGFNLGVEGEKRMDKVQEKVESRYHNTLLRFAAEECWDKENKYDSCVPCPFYSTTDHCGHPKHPKNPDKEEKMLSQPVITEGRKKEPVCPGCGGKQFSRGDFERKGLIVCNGCGVLISEEIFEDMFPRKSGMALAWDAFLGALIQHKGKEGNNNG